MHNYTVISVNEPDRMLCFDSDDAAAVLAAMVRHGLREAHVYADLRYAFTARQGSSDGGAWVIQTRPDMIDASLPAIAA